MLFEAIGQYSAIAKIAMTEVLAALNAGYSVTVVAKELDESLRGRVEWLKLYVPPRGFALQWLTARHFYKKALGSRKFDVIHAHQPQTASLADVFECHYLTRVAYQTGTLEGRKSLRGRIIRAQQQVVLYAEDYYYRRFSRETRMLYDSAVTRENFHACYGILPKEQVLLYGCPPIDFPDQAQRDSARERLLGNETALAQNKLVVGYLGGIQKRKGYEALIAAVAKDANLFLLMGGQYTDNFAMPSLSGRGKGIGLVSDTKAFYAACDVFVVPSLYEPFGLVCFEAAVRGLPVIMSPQVGAAPHLVEHGAGVVWNPPEPLGPLVRHVVADRSQFNAGAAKMAEAYSESKRAEKLAEIWERAAAEKRKT